MEIDLTQCVRNLIRLGQSRKYVIPELDGVDVDEQFRDIPKGFARRVEELKKQDLFIIFTSASNLAEYLNLTISEVPAILNELKDVFGTKDFQYETTGQSGAKIKNTMYHLTFSLAAFENYLKRPESSGITPICLEREGEGFLRVDG
ncbi:MAG TPA: hypothetical protein VGO21_04460, partial [Candidatus Paceibacterota bacterium]|nr:hypothetical protein [Candidatus Paceibacterota bacterium]